MIIGFNDKGKFYCLNFYFYKLDNTTRLSIIVNNYYYI